MITLIFLVWASFTLPCCPCAQAFVTDALFLIASLWCLQQEVLALAPLEIMQITALPYQKVLALVQLLSEAICPVPVTVRIFLSLFIHSRMHLKNKRRPNTFSWAHFCTAHIFGFFLSNPPRTTFTYLSVLSFFIKIVPPCNKSKCCVFLWCFARRCHYLAQLPRKGVLISGPGSCRRRWDTLTKPWGEVCRAVV